MSNRHVDVYFYCDGCDKELKGRFVPRGSNMEIIVEPCEYCLDELAREFEG